MAAAMKKTTPAARKPSASVAPVMRVAPARQPLGADQERRGEADADQAPRRAGRDAAQHVPAEQEMRERGGDGQRRPEARPRRVPQQREGAAGVEAAEQDREPGEAIGVPAASRAARRAPPQAERRERQDAAPAPRRTGSAASSGRAHRGRRRARASASQPALCRPSSWTMTAHQQHAGDGRAPPRPAPRHRSAGSRFRPCAARSPTRTGRRPRPGTGRPSAGRRRRRHHPEHRPDRRCPPARPSRAATSRGCG